LTHPFVPIRHPRAFLPSFRLEWQAAEKAGRLLLTQAVAIAADVEHVAVCSSRLRMVLEGDMASLEEPGTEVPEEEIPPAVVTLEIETGKRAVA
jgi:hypothetical protein